MNNITKRFLLFLIGCIGIRLLLVYLAKTQLWMLRYLGYFGAILSLGFIIIYLFGLRKTGAEVMGEKIWWNDLRPIHAILWGLFAFFAISGDKHAWIFLLVDVLIGLLSFLFHHYRQGDFSRLFS